MHSGAAADAVPGRRESTSASVGFAPPRGAAVPGTGVVAIASPRGRRTRAPTRRAGRTFDQRAGLDQRRRRSATLSRGAAPHRAAGAAAMNGAWVRPHRSNSASSSACSSRETSSQVSATPEWWAGAEGVAGSAPRHPSPAPARLARQAQLQDPAIGLERRQGRQRVRQIAASDDLVGSEVTYPSQQVVDARRPCARGDPRRGPAAPAPRSAMAAGSSSSAAPPRPTAHAGARGRGRGACARRSPSGASPSAI